MEAVAKSLELVPLGIKNHLKNLEEECGFSLFDEDGDLLKLSPQAASHLWVANRILNLHERFKMLNPLSRSRVRIAVPNGTLCTILPEFVRETIAPRAESKKGPSVRFFEREVFEDGVPGLLRGRYDLVVGGVAVNEDGSPEPQYGQYSPNLVLELLGEQAHVIPTVAVGPKKLLPPGAAIPVHELYDQPLVLIGRLADTLVTQLFRYRGINPKAEAPRVVVDTATAARALLMTGSFVGIVPNLPEMARDMTVRPITPAIRRVRIGVAHLQHPPSHESDVADDPVAAILARLRDPAIWAKVWKKISPV